MKKITQICFLSLLMMVCLHTTTASGKTMNLTHKKSIMNLSSISGSISGESYLYRNGSWTTPNASYYYYSGDVLPEDAYYVVVGPDFEYRYEAESLLPPYPLYITANDFTPGNYTLEVRYFDNTTYTTEVAASFSFVIANY